MSSLRNRVQLIGNVGNAPEVKNLESGKTVVNFSIATNETYKNKAGEKVQDTQWHRITAWNNTAEIIQKYVQKGTQLAIEGKLAHRSYEGDNGTTHYVTEIIADQVQLLGSKASA